MNTRTTNTTVTFENPFTIGGFDSEFPPGVYAVETDENLIEGLSFQAYRRTSSRFHIPADPSHPGTSHTLIIDPHELDLALEREKMGRMIRGEVDREAVERAEDEGMIVSAME